MKSFSRKGDLPSPNKLTSSGKSGKNHNSGSDGIKNNVVSIKKNKQYYKYFLNDSY